MNKQRINVVLMDEAVAFIHSLPQKIKEKITYNYLKVANGVLDSQLFKKLENSNIWEFRTMYNGNCYRLFSFWDTETDTLIIATHGIVKKTQKTPAKEIAKDEELRKRYFELKNK
jgi:phage-related protein